MTIVTAELSSSTEDPEDIRWRISARYRGILGWVHVWREDTGEKRYAAIPKDHPELGRMDIRSFHLARKYLRRLSNR